VAISLALGVATLVQPGAGFQLGENLEFSATPPPPLVETFVQLFPRNIFSAMAEGQMLQIILFAILLGLAITLSGEAGQRALAALRDWNEIILKLVQLVMLVAPVGVFALIARTFAMEGLGALGPLAKYFFVVLGVLLLHGFGTYSLLLKLFARLSPRVFFRKMREVQIFAFSTASSNATIPVTLTTVEKKLGVSNPVASFTVPLGATINMDGTAIMQGVATVFIAQAYGISLTAGDLLVVVLTATLASIGTAGVPGVGLVMLSMVLVQAGLPVEGIALIIGIDRLLDMVRTAVNVTGDAVVSCIVGRREGEIDLAVFDSH
jgi:Na+/H+-dicarboxylate symporter